MAFCSPLLTILADARSPSNKPIASISKDFPAPVSPVIAVNPLSKSILRLLIIAKFLTVKLCNNSITNLFP